MSRAISDYAPSSGAIAFDVMPLKVQALDLRDGEIMVKTNDKWFRAADVAESDRELLREVHRYATVELMKRDALNG